MLKTVHAAACAPIDYQRRAVRWIAGLRRESRQHGVIPLRLDGVELDPLDLLKSPLLLANGHLLQAVDEGNERHLGRGPGLRASLFRARQEVGRVGRALLHGPRSQEASGAVMMLPRLSSHLPDLLAVGAELERSRGYVPLFLLTDGDLESFVPEGRTVDLYGHSGLRAVSAPVLSRAFLSSLSSLAPPLVAVDRGGDDVSLKLFESTLRVIAMHLPDVLRIVSGCTQLARMVTPKALVVGNPYTFEGRTAASTARQLGIPVAVIEHGSIFANDPIWEEAPVDLVCARGGPSQRALLSCGVPAEHIAVTGSPGLDPVYRRFQDDGGGHSRTTVLVASSGPGDQVTESQHAAFVDMIVRAAEATPQLEWVVKLHKKDRRAIYLDPGTGQPRGGLRVEDDSTAHHKGLSFFDYLQDAAVLVTVFSTTATDAMIFGVPVVTVRMEGLRAAEDIEFLEFTRSVTSAEELARVVSALVAGERGDVDERARAYAADHHWNLGSATQVTAKAIGDLIDRREHAC